MTAAPPSVPGNLQRYRALSTPGLTVSPLEVTGWPWSGRVFVTPGPSVDFPVLEFVVPDSV